MRTETTERQRIPRIQAKILNAILNSAQLPDPEVHSLLASENLRRADVRDPHGTLPFAAYLRLFDRVAERLGRDCFGLELSSGMGPELVGPAGYIFVASPDLIQAVRALASSVFTIQDATLFEVRSDPAPHVRYRITDDDMSPRRHDVEFSLGYVNHLIRLLLGPGYAPAEVWFEHPGPARPERQEALLGCPVFFDQDRNAIWFRPEDVHRRAPGADPNLVALMQHYIQLLDRPDHTIQTFTEEVRQTLAGLADGQEPSLVRVAAQLGVGASTLGRRLRAEGSSFRDLVRRNRIDRATRLLLETKLSVLEIAERSGYGETASFTRAFRSVTGETPRAYRARLLDARLGKLS
ncbi:AraC family transcriptional regulator [Phaeobacter sp. HF9A]|uniref:AraC family transcriptional regulator n=1 Tax=Phaeobacter sp. HF9A TaxID=2721561 RepID=UPI001431C2C2|nr:AraC family transcriptional regulator [Phaeobacter sp. HF9A]NIZ12107.1 AraC family transcriptional regulator [Phaeobacter sp. HF9A]